MSRSAPLCEPRDDDPDEEHLVLPAHVAGSGTLDRLVDAVRLVDAARGYARAATAQNTNKAYAADWRHFARWCRGRGTDPLPSSAEVIGLYLTDLAAPTGGSPAQSASRPLSVSTIERRLSGLAWNAAQRSFTLDRTDRHIASVLAGIRRRHARPPVQKEAILPEDILDMVATLPHDLRGLRNGAILLLGFPQHRLGQHAVGRLGPQSPYPLRPSSWGSASPTSRRLPGLAWNAAQRGFRLDRTDRHIATVRDAGIRADLPEAGQPALFSGNRSGSGSAEVDER